MLQSLECSVSAASARLGACYCYANHSFVFFGNELEAWVAAFGFAGSGFLYLFGWHYVGLVPVSRCLPVQVTAVVFNFEEFGADPLSFG
ncbi:hypothetical protein Nepgr_021406 [Nepenthes gracilis]|uniref:Uncharacterized protein n=1 Tax=Nepenthes gracilis TaxID=150966 RepID=A0AAD3SXG4_NEPGR|nr:hypothetical protein Nepgr_021406 [Nepenthes gracilis]